MSPSSSRLVGFSIAGFVGATALALLVTYAGRLSTSGARVDTSRPLRIGYAVEAPFAYVDATGRVTGESPEIARVIAHRLGFAEVRWTQTDFGSLLDELLEGRYDVAAAGVFITPGRAQRVAFSRPTCHVSGSLLVPRGNPRALHSYADAVASGARVAVLGGSVEEGLLKELGCPTSRLVRVADARSARRALESGSVDAMALSLPTVRWMSSRAGTATEPAVPFVPPPAELTRGLGFGAFAFRPGDEALRSAWEDVLAVFIGSDEHRRLVAPFGFSADMIPAGVSSTDVLRRR